MADFTGRSQTTIITAHRVPQIKASEIITLELGRQTELKVTKQLEREVNTDRFTRLVRNAANWRPFSTLPPAARNKAETLNTG